ncbi:MAG: hypothetical protein GEU74_06775 [Nitriliruptorales bacterium]|nr:hypothetical protein [Nitriliruptorales bacterium]
MTADRDRTTVKRALVAGAVAGAVAGTLALAGVMANAVPGALVIAAVIAGSSFVAAGWLLLSAVLDILAGDPPDARRTAWTAGAALLAMLGPFLLLGTFTQAGGGSP